MTVTKGFLADLRNSQTPSNPRIIFDVGANQGQSIESFRNVYPEAHIHSFEPIRSTFAILQRQFGTDSRVSLHCLALDKTERQVKFIAVPGSTGNRILLGDEDHKNIEVVTAVTGDSFCAKQDIESIDILKIDTEGNDLNVLVGFSALFKARAINYVQVECTTSTDNTVHVQLDRFMHFLGPFGYRLFGLYEFTRQIYRTKQKLNGIWFCNAVFVREVDNARFRTERIN